jgi:hypothetical protein
MLIAGVQAGNALYSLVKGQPLPITVGQTIRVFFSFKYKMPEREDVAIWASLYQYTAGILNRAGKAQTKATIMLDRTTEWKDYQGYIDITVGSVSAGTYGLIVELPGRKDAEAKIDDCLEVMAAPGIAEWVGPLLVLGLMAGMVGMMAPMMEEKSK